jgi:DNA-binding NarL/FixJ family response regulator
LGVGQKLEKENQGLDIVVSLKEKYPEKKVAVYSSKETHNMFHPANEIVDKRISKRGGDFEVFRKAIEELSAKCYNWDYVIDEIYKRIRHELPEEIDRERLKKELEKSVTNRKKINRKRIMKILKVSKDNYNFIILAIQLVLSI